MTKNSSGRNQPVLQQPVKKANKISARAIPTAVVLDEETRTGFEVRYDTGEVAGVSWSFIRELPPKK